MKCLKYKADPVTLATVALQHGRVGIFFQKNTFIQTESAFPLQMVNYNYLAPRIQQPIPELRILNFHDFFYPCPFIQILSRFYPDLSLFYPDLILLLS